MPFVRHDEAPPAAWPENISYLTKPRLSSKFPTSLIPYLYDRSCSTPKKVYQPPKAIHPAHLGIKKINDPKHPASGQFSLVAKKKIPPNELIIPYIGVIHATITPVNPEGLPSPSSITADGQAPKDDHAESDYDLCLNTLSGHNPANPMPGKHISIGVDASEAGNAGRFVNDYRGIAAAPNAEFRFVSTPTGELRMEIWSLKSGVPKGGEILISYGKSWWAARQP